MLLLSSNDDVIKFDLFYQLVRISLAQSKSAKCQVSSLNFVSLPSIGNFMFFIVFKMTASQNLIDSVS